MRQQHHKEFAMTTTITTLDAHLALERMDLRHSEYIDPQLGQTLKEGNPPQDMKSGSMTH